MKNLEQIRAKNAMNFANKGTVKGKEGGEVMKKIPPIVMNNGLLAAIAYSYDQKEGWRQVFDAVAVHLSDQDIHIVHLTQNQQNRDGLMTELMSGDSMLLRRATAETLAWLNYARRFVNPKGDDSKGGQS
jgi:CRISPR/Cas system CMR-associated protein Cmr5 small subunit